MKDRLKNKGAKIAAAAAVLEELPVRNPGGHVHRSFVLYGRSGTGKTTIASSFPKPMLFLDVKDVGDDSISDVEDLKVMDVREWNDFEMAYWWLKRNPKRYKSLAIDTVSQLQQLAIRKVLEDKSKDADHAGEWGVMTKREWGEVASLMKIWITNLRDLPMDVCFIAQDRTFNVSEEDEAEGLEPEVGPGLSPSIAKHLNANVHHIGNTFIRRKTFETKNGKKVKAFTKTQFCMRVAPHPVYITKIRKPKGIIAPGVIVDPTYDKLVAIIKGEE
jgi:hypothetical protein